MNKCYNKSKKKFDPSKIKRLNCSVDWSTKSITKDGKGNIFVEGFANTSDKDRVGDVVLPSAFEKTLKEYLENPVLLYQHNWDDIIGQVTEAKIVDEGEKQGLWIKASISNAKDVESVRTKINEGSLKTFSIGYNELDADWDKESGTNVVKEVELLEISVVTIPCNAKATFTATEVEGKTIVDDNLLKYLSNALKDLDSKEEVDASFLKDIISIYNNQ